MPGSCGRLPRGAREPPPHPTVRRRGLCASRRPGGTAAETSSGTVGTVQDRARSFDTVADLYDEMRPRYPDALFDDLVDPQPGPARCPGARDRHRTGRRHPSAGPARAAHRGPRAGPGAGRGGPRQPGRVRLGRDPRDHLRGRPSSRPASFDLVVSASAWHWVDPEIGPAKAARVLRPGGAPGRVVGPRRAGRRADARRQPGRARALGARAGCVAPRAAGRASRRRAATTPSVAADGPEIRQAAGRAALVRADRAAPPPVRASPTTPTPTCACSTPTPTTGCSTPTSARGLFDELVAVIETDHGGRVTRQYSATLFVARRNQVAAP